MIISPWFLPNLTGILKYFTVVILKCKYTFKNTVLDSRKGYRGTERGRGHITREVKGCHLLELGGMISFKRL